MRADAPHPAGHAVQFAPETLSRPEERPSIHLVWHQLTYVELPHDVSHERGFVEPRLPGTVVGAFEAFSLSSGFDRFQPPVLLPLPGAGLGIDLFLGWFRPPPMLQSVAARRRWYSKVFVVARRS